MCKDSAYLLPQWQCVYIYTRGVQKVCGRIELKIGLFCCKIFWNPRVVFFHLTHFHELFEDWSYLKRMYAIVRMLLISIKILLCSLLSSSLPLPRLCSEPSVHNFLLHIIYYICLLLVVFLYNIYPLNSFSSGMLGSASLCSCTCHKTWCRRYWCTGVGGIQCIIT